MHNYETSCKNELISKNQLGGGEVLRQNNCVFTQPIKTKINCEKRVNFAIFCRNKCMFTRFADVIAYVHNSKKRKSRVF